MAVSKKAAKGRLDKYYHLAKEQGYRARSAYKLIQLNQKYNFLEKSRVLVDLCAAPGGWLQVASKYMPMSKVIIGVDLAPIKPLPGVITITSDITTPGCRRELQASLSGWKADVVLHDGAPNVGASWDHDAYAQAELVLHSLHLATDLLRPGGIFVTKVFRSKDYNALLYVFNTLFKSVEATKPASSRNVSAEIFVICKDFLAPKKIDPRLLDPKSVFSVTSHLQVDGGSASIEASSINILRPEKHIRHRGGYEDGSILLYKEANLETFLLSSDPVSILSSVNAILLPSKDSPSQISQQIAEILESNKVSEDIRESCNDLKLLGRKEFHQLLRWRLSLRRHLKKIETSADATFDHLSKESLPDVIISLPKVSEKQKLIQTNEPKLLSTLSNENLTKFDSNSLPKVDTHLEDLLQNAKDQDAKKEKKAKKKALLRKAKEREKLQLGITGPDNSFMETHDQELFSTPSFPIPLICTDGELDSEDDKKDNFAQDDNDEAYDLDRQLETLYSEYKERCSKKRPFSDVQPYMEVNSFNVKHQSSSQRVDLYTHQDQEDFHDNDNTNNLHKDDGISPYNNNLDLFKEEIEPTKTTGLNQRIDLLFARKNFKVLEENETELENVTPSGRKASSKLKKQCSNANERQKNINSGKKNPNNDSTIEFVKAEEPFLSHTQDKNDDLSINEEDQTEYKKIICSPQGISLALALRSTIDDEPDEISENKSIKTSSKDFMIDASFNRYAFDDRHLSLPSWFIEDESKHNVPQTPITKEAIQVVRSQLKTMAARIPKKALEAKARAKNRALKSLISMQARAGSIAESEELSEMQKSSALSKLRTSSKKPKGSKKTVVVARGANKATKGRPRGIKGRYKMVDARLKKEIRALKRKNNKKKR